MHKIQIPIFFLILATISFGARVIQEGEENATCFPEDFETYRWALAGNTWFTETKGKGPWLNVADECAKIEPGRTSLGGPRTETENSRISNHFRDDKYYMNAVQVGGRDWYWFLKFTEKSYKVEIVNWTNWDRGQPDSEFQSCGVLWNENKKWDDDFCILKFRGICELRCDSL